MGSEACSFLLTAAFDIDKGPQIKHQYPQAINGDEQLLANLMLPDQAHAREEDWTIFFLHEVQQSGNLKARNELSTSSLTHVLNLVNTKHDKDAKRGAYVIAMAICTPFPFLHIFKPLLLLGLNDYFRTPTLDILARIYDSVNSMDVSGVPKLSYYEQCILADSSSTTLFAEKFTNEADGDKTQPDHVDSKSYIDLAPGASNRLINGKISHDTHEFESKICYNGLNVPIKLPVTMFPETIGDASVVKLFNIFSGPHISVPQPFQTHPHLTTNGPLTHPIIVLLNAILTQKRVVFMGHGKPSGEVADVVLAACAMASGGILRGFSEYAFPYTELSKVDDLLQVPGFIAGVTNPAFELHESWWDLLCNIDTGRIQISSQIGSIPEGQDERYAKFQSTLPSTDAGRYDGSDAAFMEEIQNMILARHHENAIRRKFTQWIFKFTQIACAYEEIVYQHSLLWIGDDEKYVVKGHGYIWVDESTKARDLAVYMARVEGWRGTRSYSNYIKDLLGMCPSQPVLCMDLQHQVDRLRLLRLSNQEASIIYQALDDYVVSYDSTCQLLSLLPQSQGGIVVIANGLFHPDVITREAVFRLLNRISTHMAGRHFISALNRFHYTAFVRQQSTHGFA